MIADPINSAQRRGPIGPDVIGVIIERLANPRIVDFARYHRPRNARRYAPRARLLDAQRFALARERELAGERMIAVLIDDAANIGGVEPAAHPVEHDLRHGRLTGLGLAARFKIDRLCEAAHLPRRIARIDEAGVMRFNRSVVALGHSDLRRRVRPRRYDVN